MPAFDPGRCAHRNRVEALRYGVNAVPLRLFRTDEQAEAFKASDEAFKQDLAASGTLPRTADACMAAINAGLPEGAPELTKDDVYIHLTEAANSNLIADRWMFLHGSTLKNIARDGAAGVSLMNSHRTATLSTPSELPFGKTFSGRYERLPEGGERSLVGVYMKRGIYPNGANGPSTDDLHELIAAGTLKDVSVGLWPGGEGEAVCDVCGNGLWAFDEQGDWLCRHVPGTTREMSADQQTSQKKRGVPKGCATYSLHSFSMGEISGVYDGAVPGAGFKKMFALSRTGALAGADLAAARDAYAFMGGPKEQDKVPPLEAVCTGWESRTLTDSPVATVTLHTLSAPIEEPTLEARAASYSDHSQSVLAAVQEYVTRSEGYAALRAQDGRQPSQDRRADWQALYERLGVLLTNTAPPPDPLPGLHLKHLSLRADLARLSVGRHT